VLAAFLQICAAYDPVIDLAVAALAGATVWLLWKYTGTTTEMHKVALEQYREVMEQDFASTAPLYGFKARSRRRFEMVNQGAAVHGLELSPGGGGYGAALANGQGKNAAALELVLKKELTPGVPLELTVSFVDRRDRTRRQRYTLACGAKAGRTWTLDVKKTSLD
jgi:hypothetical protein